MTLATAPTAPAIGDLTELATSFRRSLRAQNKSPSSWRCAVRAIPSAGSSSSPVWVYPVVLLPGYTWHALVGAPGTLPGGEFAAAFRLIWMPTLAMALLAVMPFPNGVPLSHRWAVLMAAMSAVYAVTLVCGVFEPGRIALGHPIPEGAEQGNGPTIPNPLGVGGRVGPNAGRRGGAAPLRDDPGVYGPDVGGLLAIQTLMRPLTSGSELGVAIATLGSFALFSRSAGASRAPWTVG